MYKEIKDINFLKIKRQLIRDKEINQIRLLLNHIYQNNICKWRPLMDEYNYYQYFDNQDKGTKVRKIIHQIVLGDWGKHSKEQKQLINLLVPLKNLVLQINGELENSESPPSKGYCSRYSFNCYPNKDGYLSAHTDQSWDMEKSRVLVILSKYSKNKNQGFWVMNGEKRVFINELTTFEPGDAIIFNQTNLHGFCNMKLSSDIKNIGNKNIWLDPYSSLDCTFYHALVSQYKSPYNK